jgi:lipoprotein-releasing system ATP-binding protein
MFKVQRPTSEVEEGPGIVLGQDAARRTTDVALQVSELQKSFSSPVGERIEVLRDISFSASAGEIIAITGASGAGKSTLLHLLGGLEAADHGSIRLGQYSSYQQDGGSLARFRNRQIGFIFQFHHLLPDLSATENVAMPLMISRVGQREACRRAVQVLAELGLGRRISHRVGNLSGGEQQRVALGRALITLPLLVLADEPTGNLDWVIGEEISKSLVKYARERRAIVILATHNAELARLCDRILVLRDGRVEQIQQNSI